MHHHKLFIQFIFQLIRNKPTKQMQPQMSYQSETAVLSTMAPYSLQQFQPGAKQLNNDFLKSWPELTVKQVTKYTPIYEATFKSHMHE